MLRYSIILFGVCISGCYYPQEVQTCMDDVECVNNGFCVEGVCQCEFESLDCNTLNGAVVFDMDSCLCACDAGYEGANCNTEERADFIGSYNVTESCNSGNFTYSITATISSANISSIIITNFGDYNVSVIGTIDGDFLTIPSQSVGGGTFSGSGQIAGNFLIISYSVTAGTSADSCTMTCTKE
jgi:hypothetical protein